jgi:hypothetical protein
MGEGPLDGYTLPAAGGQAPGIPIRRTSPRAAAFPTSAVDVRGEGADVAQVAIALGEVEPVADDELVGDVEADPARGRHRPWRRRACAAGCRSRPTPGCATTGSCAATTGSGPESRMSSTMRTCLPVMSASRSLRMRTTPGGLGARAVGRDRHPVHVDARGSARMRSAITMTAPLRTPTSRKVLARVVRWRSRRPAPQFGAWICSSVIRTFSRSLPICLQRPRTSSYGSTVLAVPLDARTIRAPAIGTHAQIAGHGAAGPARASRSAVGRRRRYAVALTCPAGAPASMSSRSPDAGAQRSAADRPTHRVERDANPALVGGRAVAITRDFDSPLELPVEPGRRPGSASSSR